MTTDAIGLEILSREECLALLASVHVGRVVYTDRALPAIEPVNFVLDDGTVVFQASTASTLAAATRWKAVVAFEADHFDEATRTGWSVTAVGRWHRVEGDNEIACLRELPFQLWFQDADDHFVRIELSQMTGRRLAPSTVT